MIAQKIAGENVEFNCLLVRAAEAAITDGLDDVGRHHQHADELALDASKEFVNIANGNALRQTLGRRRNSDDAATGNLRNHDDTLPISSQGCRLRSSRIAGCQIGCRLRVLKSVTQAEGARSLPFPNAKQHLT